MNRKITQKQVEIKTIISIFKSVDDKPKRKANQLNLYSLQKS